MYIYLQSNYDVHRCDWLEWRGNKYYQNDFVLCGFGDDDSPQFGKVHEILIIEKRGFLFYTILKGFTIIITVMFTKFTCVYLCLHLFTYVYHVYSCLPIFTLVYLYLHLFTYVYPCLLVFTYVYSCSPLFTTV